MRKKKIPIEKILEIKSREAQEEQWAQPARWALFKERFIRISHSFAYVKSFFEEEELKEVQDELLRYFPIAIVAAFESFIRRAVKDIIDGGLVNEKDLYDFSRDITFDLEFLRKFTKAKITEGDIIASSLAISNLGHAEKCFEKLLGKNFLEIFKEKKIVEKFENEKPKLISIFDFVEEPSKGIVKLFSQRHVYCHEFAPREKINIKELDKSLNSAMVFVFFLDNYIRKIGREKYLRKNKLLQKK